MRAQDKSNRYKDALEQLRYLLGTQELDAKYQLDDIGKMAIIASVLKKNLPHFFFVGFYRHTSERMLQIGPYQGDVLACGTIPFGRGVCGVCADEVRTLIVPDVAKFPTYIACDDQTRSEIVVPLVRDGRLFAVLDVDGIDLGDFDEIDREYLERMVAELF